MVCSPRHDHLGTMTFPTAKSARTPAPAKANTILCSVCAVCATDTAGDATAQAQISSSSNRSIQVRPVPQHLGVETLSMPLDFALLNEPRISTSNNHGPASSVTCLKLRQSSAHQAVPAQDARLQRSIWTLLMTPSLPASWHAPFA